jgi:2C-methyl-D-erythritol 2,4-cyclodiphosphate synthase
MLTNLLHLIVTLDGFLLGVFTLVVMTFSFVALCDIGDVLLHHIVDAILRTLRILDNRMLFLDDDPKWCAVAFCVFVKEVVNFYYLHILF